MAEHSTPTTEDPASADDRMPAPEAFAHVLAVTAHQHAAAVPEDAPAEPVQGRLPIPRPPFDMANAWRQIREKRAEVRRLGLEWQAASEQAKKKHKAFLDADGELKELLDRLANEEREAEASTQPELPIRTRECAWEREHPGQVCHICEALREQHISAEEAEELHTSTPQEPPAELPHDEPPLDEPEPDPTITVGSLCIANAKTGVCDIGEYVVCYEVYDVPETRDEPGYHGYSFLFETGRHDGFTPGEVRQMLTITGEVCEAVRDYQFTNAVQLMRDYRKGRFEVLTWRRPSTRGEGGA